MKIIGGIVVSFILGFLSHLVLSGKTGNAEHWKRIETYNAYANDPANFKRDPETGLTMVIEPAGVDESLAALVDAGELSHMDLIFPIVPYNHDSAAVWMKYCHSHKEIVYATGNPSHTGIEITGAQPLHLNLWFRPSDVAVVQSLAKQLQGEHAK